MINDIKQSFSSIISKFGKSTVHLNSLFVHPYINFEFKKFAEVKIDYLET